MAERDGDEPHLEEADPGKSGKSVGHRNDRVPLDMDRRVPDEDHEASEGKHIGDLRDPDAAMQILPRLGVDVHRTIRRAMAVVTATSKEPVTRTSSNFGPIDDGTAIGHELGETLGDVRERVDLSQRLN